MITSHILYKLSGDVVLRTIDETDLSGDFIFIDKRTGKTFAFNAGTTKFSEAELQEYMWQNFDSSMVNNLNFLRVVSFIKKGKISTSYEPKIISTIIDNVKINFYVDDPNIKGDGLWIDLNCANNGYLSVHEWGKTVNLMNTFSPAKIAEMGISPDAPKRRVCEIIVGGEMVYSDHVII